MSKGPYRTHAHWLNRHRRVKDKPSKVPNRAKGGKAGGARNSLKGSKMALEPVISGAGTGPFGSQ
jgi:hypothetical protein